MEKRKVFKISIIDKEISRTEFDRVTFYTSDSELSLVFKLIERNYTYDNGEILLYNEDDKSFVTREVTKKDNDFVYEIDSDIIPHYGKWKAQLQLVNDGDVYTSKPFEFNIVNEYQVNIYASGYMLKGAITQEGFDEILQAIENIKNPPELDESGVIDE